LDDSVEKVESRSLLEIRLNGSEIFGLIWLPLQIDYGHLGLTLPRVMRSPASLSRNEAYGAGKNQPCPQTDFSSKIGPKQTLLANVAAISAARSDTGGLVREQSLASRS
jgi:hypothetical protein